MSLETSKVKDELATLKQKRVALDIKIKGLEDYLGISSSSSGKMRLEGISARGGVDISPTVRAIFGANGNQPIKHKDLIGLVGKKHSDMGLPIIETKMINVKRKLLEKGEAYGTYRLKAETPQPSGQGAV